MAAAKKPRTAADIVRGLGALLLIAGLLAGIPAGLLGLGGPPPLPAGLPTLSDVLDAITRPDDGTLLVAALIWVGWIGWLTLLVSLAVEIPAAARGVTAPRLPALGPQQRLAAGLVAAAAMLFTAGPASLASSPPAHADSYTAAAGTTSHDDPAAPAAEWSSTVDVHVVERGDTLWDIAETHLGNGRRYPELFDATAGTVQPDGRRLTDPDLIHPGWRITIPDGDVPAEEIDTPPDPDDANTGTERDTGTADSMGPTITPEPSPTTETDQSAASVPTTADPPRSDNLPAAPVPAAGSSADEAAPVADGTVDDTDGEGTADVCTVGGIGAALAGGLLFYVGAHRARQHRRRKPGERIAMPDGPASEFESDLRTVHDPVTLDHVNRALRTLAARCAVTGADLPTVRYARLIGGQLELHLDAPADVPAPFSPTASPNLWVLDPDADVLDAWAADDYPAPYPALVTAGHDADGGLVLINLEQAGAIGVHGDPDAAAEVVAGMAAELVTSLWSDDVHVTAIGVEPKLSTLIDGDRIRDVDPTSGQIDQVIADLAARANADQTALDAVDAPSLHAARLARVAGGTWPPEIVIVGSALTDTHRDQLTRLIDSSPRLAIAAVTTGESLTEWAVRLDTTDADHAVLDPIGLGVRPQRLGPDEQARLGNLLAATRADPVPAPPDWHVDTTAEPAVDDIPDGDWPEPAAALAAGPVDGAPVVAVLGPVEIRGASELAEWTKRGQLTALAAYLALNPGQTRDAVDQAMWPGRRVSLSTRNTAMTKLRNWLGADTDGIDYVPRAAADGYRLHPAVRTDWHRFTELLPDGPADASTENLIAALDLVRGQPFAGANPRRYIWAEGIQQEMIAAIVDVADELARRALHAGNHRLALRAVTAGLTADRGSEVLWRHRLRAHHVANDRDALEHAADQLTALADDLGGDLDDDTTKLLTQLLSGVPHETPATTPGRTA